MFTQVLRFLIVGDTFSTFKLLFHGLFGIKGNFKENLKSGGTGRFPEATLVLLVLVQKPEQIQPQCCGFKCDQRVRGESAAAQRPLEALLILPVADGFLGPR